MRRAPSPGGVLRRHRAHRDRRRRRHSSSRGPTRAVGNHALTAVATDNDGATSTSAAVNIHVLPGVAAVRRRQRHRFLASSKRENFNEGGEGVGYHDLTAGNTGGQYRQTDVDIVS
mgnify:CR=1 FL=1